MAFVCSLSTGAAERWPSYSQIGHRRANPSPRPEADPPLTQRDSALPQPGHVCGAAEVRYLARRSPSALHGSKEQLQVSRVWTVSKAAADLMNYCEQHARSDPLLVGVPASENPFKDKKPCIIL
ncbi:guanine nucleotide-binding protein G(I)/G(S)/G(O) subunit gamma-7 [Arapaima gigas]